MQKHMVFLKWCQPYLLDHMSVDFAAERGEQLTAVGEGPYEGMTVTLAGGSGANNQTSPDVVGLRDPETASELWRFGDASLAGVAAETCVPHRSLFFSFGLEGVADASDRSDVLQRGIDWLITEPPTAGLRISHLTNPTQVANPGEMVTHVISLRHIGARGVTETITVSVEGGDWPTLVNPAAFELSPCSEMPVTVTVAIPLDVGINAVDIVTLAARSDLNTAPVTLSLVSKAPAPVLLVDDDRWYPMEQRYIDALAVAGIPFDLWDTLSSSSGSAGLFSPDTHTLLRYPIVIWFTGYDWYAPLVDVEIERLLDYVDQGGRLLLSSQDYAYHHEESPLTGRLGILLADWTDEATEAGAVVEHPAGGLWGPLVLDYPFPNWSQTIEPAPEAAPVIRGQLGQPVGIGVGTAEHGGGETLFYAFPLEALPLETHSQALANGVGWLSPLGGSHWDLTPTVCAPGDAVSFHLTLRNSDTVTLTVAFTHAVPEDFAISPGQLPPELDYSVMSQEISWSGPVAPMGEVPLTWHAVWRGTTALPSMPSVTLSLPAWELSTSRTAPFYGVGPDLTASDWLTDGLGGARSGEAISVTYAIRNTSGVAADDVELSLWMMRGVGPITATTPLTGGLAMPVWQGSVASQETQTATLLIQGRPWDVPLRVDALLEDGAGLRWEDSLWLALDPWQSFLPVVTRSD